MKLFLDILHNQVKNYNDEKIQLYIKKLKDQSDKLRELVSDLLDVSRIQTGKLIFHKENMRLDELIKDTIEALTPTTTNHRFTLETQPVTVLADRFRVYQVVTNLVMNAIKYSPKKKTIKIEIVKKKRYVLVSVRDFGIGLGKEEHEKIFERLYQVKDPEAKMYPGLGMGLYISKDIIQRHGGKIWVKSKKNKGSTFFHLTYK